MEKMEQNNPNSAQKGDLEVTGVSRSGRVRKKSSKLMDFQSPDEIETRTKKAAAIAAKQQHQIAPKTQQPAAHHTSNHLQSFSQIHSNKPDIDSSKSDDDQMDFHEEQDDSDEIDSDDDDMDDMVIDNDEASDSYVDPGVRQSIYMSEKSNKKKVMKDGKMVYGKAQRKDKGKTRFTAYMLWAKDARKQMLAQQPDLDFGSISRRLGEMWANVPMSEKLSWKRRLKRFISKPKGPENNATNVSSKFLNKGQTFGNHTTPNNSGSKANTMSSMASSETNNNTSGNSRTKKQSQSELSIANDFPDHFSQSQNKKSNHTTSNKLSPTSSVGMYKVTGIEPVDVAAHLKLLGDSLTIIGERLKEHEGQITVSGSLSVLLDSLLCSLGPLMCLTTQIPGFNEKNQHVRDTLHDTLDNIAYVMPGL